jgi:two-component system phosphate regulon sensor histidine kinase PhoR
MPSRRPELYAAGNYARRILGRVADDLTELVRLTDHVGLGVLRVGPRRTIERANHAAHRLLGKRSGSLHGRTVMEAFLDHRVEEMVAGSLGGQSASMEVGAPDEHRLVVRSRPAVGGGAWIVLEDVTELRRLQRIRAEFIDNLSHELRTPLTTVRLLTERLLDELQGLEVPAHVRDRVSAIDVETGHLVQMVNELLDLSRIEQATTQLQLEDVAVSSLCEAALARLRTFADRQEVELRADLAPELLPAIRGDGERLGQLLVNLLHNAVKFSPPGSAVTVGAESSNGEVVLHVTDQGIGIPRADQARIFERFYKVDRARERSPGGTGLGLAIARHIAEAHGGRIWVESQEGSGSTFSVALPAVEAG